MRRGGCGAGPGRRGPRGLLAVLGLLAGCAGGGMPATPGALSGGSPAGGGLVVVTEGGRALIDGATDVEPSLALRIVGNPPTFPPSTSATLDGVPLPLTPSGGGLAASTAPMPLASAHSLVLRLPGRPAQTFGFHVVAPGEAYAAVHQEPGRGEVLDLILSLAPADRSAVIAALPPGGSPVWRDSTHLRASWATPPPGGALRLPSGLPTDRESHLGAPLAIDLGSAPAVGTLRATLATADGPQVSSPALPVLAFSTSTAASHASLQAHAGQVSVLSPTGLSAGPDGSVSGSPDAVAVDIASRLRIPLLPLVQNAGFDAGQVHTLLTSPVATGRLVQGLRGRSAAGGWGGVQLDFENVEPGDRDALSALVAALAVALHADHRRLDVAVVPHRPGHVNAVNAAYDIAAIARSADRVTLMAYEEHSASTEPGPVAGLAWDGELLDGSLGEVGDPRRALLGLALYARTWNTVGGGGADSYTASLAGALAVDGGARLDYDFVQGTPSVGGLAVGRPVTWFDDASSLARKVRLGAARGVGGIAVWRLGFEDPAFWNLVPAAAVSA